MSRELFCTYRSLAKSSGIILYPECCLANSSDNILYPECCLANSSDNILYPECCLANSSDNILHPECCLANSSDNILYPECCLANSNGNILYPECCLANLGRHHLTLYFHTFTPRFDFSPQKNIAAHLKDGSYTLYICKIKFVNLLINRCYRQKAHREHRSPGTNLLHDRAIR